MSSTNANVRHWVNIEIGDTDEETRTVLIEYGVPSSDVCERIDIYDNMCALMTFEQYESVKADRRTSFIDDEWG